MIRRRQQQQQPDDAGGGVGRDEKGGGLHLVGGGGGSGGRRSAEAARTVVVNSDSIGGGGGGLFPSLLRGRPPPLPHRFPPAVSAASTILAGGEEDETSGGSGGRLGEAVLTPEGFIRTIEWDMMDKTKFFPMSMASSFTVRCFLYPLTLVRTRLQVQHQADVYKGTWDAFKKIVQAEGVRGLYRGFWVSAFQVVSGVCYVSTYEGVRHALEQNGVSHTSVKAFVGGGAASVVGQTIIVPFDVISQHLMIIGQKVATSSPASSSSSAAVKPTSAVSRVNPLNIDIEGRSRAQLVGDITRAIYRRDGLRGYYRGYTASLFTYVPSSASWWTFYHLFQDVYGSLPLVPLLPQTALQCASAMSAGCASCFITNPLDLVRTRVQVQRKTIPETVRLLWAAEGLGVFTKGLTARLTASVIYSVAIIFGYESVKRWSVREEYKDRIRW